MSLSIFSVRNQWHKNGIDRYMKEYGGLQRSQIVLSVRRLTIVLESKEGSFPTNFTIFVSKCSTESISKAPTSPI